LTIFYSNRIVLLANFEAESFDRIAIFFKQKAIQPYPKKRWKQISSFVLIFSNDISTGIEIGIFVEPLDLPSHQLVFFAVNDNDSVHSAGGSHWYIILYLTSKF